MLFRVSLYGSIIPDTLIYDDGSKFVGSIKNGRANGSGSYFFPNGDKYVGELKDDLMEGRGMYFFTNGDIYTGDFKNDMFNGQGKFESSNGEKYFGNFKDDMYEGQGTKSWPNGDRYVGNFSNDTFDGYGAYMWSNGDAYIGNYENGEFSGQGSHIWSDGEKFVGVWKEDKRNGYGTVTYANGEQFLGEWKNDEVISQRTDSQRSAFQPPTRNLSESQYFYFVINGMKKYIENEKSLSEIMKNYSLTNQAYTENLVMSQKTLLKTLNEMKQGNPPERFIQCEALFAQARASYGILDTKAELWKITLDFYHLQSSGLNQNNDIRFANDLKELLSYISELYVDIINTHTRAMADIYNASDSMNSNVKNMGALK